MVYSGFVVRFAFLFEFLLIFNTSAFSADNARTDADEVRALKAVITHDFKDPDAAKWRNLKFARAAGKDRLVILCGEVNGKNSYGAYVGFRRFVVAAASRTSLLRLWRVNRCAA